MKLNIANPFTGLQKCIEINDEQKLAIFYGKRMGQEIEADALGDEFKGYILKITGGNDKDGFTMKQGILVQGRVRILMGAGHKCYRPRRSGERKRKSVRGCIAGPDLSAIALSVIKPGAQDIAGLTDDKKPRRKGPKRATRIRKLFNLSKKDDVRRYVLLYTRTVKTKNDKTIYKRPAIQRLVTDRRLRRKRIYKQEKKERYVQSKKDAEAYHKLVDKVRSDKRAALAKKRREEKDAKTETVTKQTEVKKVEKATKKTDLKKKDVKPADAKGTKPKPPQKGAKK